METETIFAFMDIGPIAKGHCLVIPKCESVFHKVEGWGNRRCLIRGAQAGAVRIWRLLVILKSGCGSEYADILDHAEKLTDLPDEHMSEILPALKKLAVASVRHLISLR